jgi:hypothetical protein
MIGNAIDWFVQHQAAVGLGCVLFFGGLKVLILYHCPSHPLYRGGPR